MDKILLTINYLKNKFGENIYFKENPYALKYRYEHSLRVANIGKLIAEGEGFDKEAFMIACLLHDVGYCVPFEKEDDWLNHGRISARIAKDFVESLGFSKDVEADILYGIAIHVDDKSDFDGVRTPFAIAIGDADNIDRFDVYRIYETLKSEKFDDLEYNVQVEKVQNRIKWLEKLLSDEYATPTSTKLFHEKLEYQIDFYNRLLSQLNNSAKVNM